MTRKIFILIFALFTMFYVYSAVNEGVQILEAGAMKEQDFPTNI
tara:strand:- start:1980 stop:2111 length:132 start_codon:yes stop_codon:yes gene_type:complete